MEDKAVKAIMQRIVSWLAGETNHRINEWVNEDEESYQKIIEFMNRCAENGWVNVTDSPFNYTDEEAVEIANTLYEKATIFFGGGK